MSRYICEQCGDDWPKAGVCDICGQPYSKMEDEEKEVEVPFDDEEFN